MTDQPAATAPGKKPGNWKVWSLPRPVLGYVLGVELVALTVLVVSFFRPFAGSPEVADLGRAALLIALGVVSAEVTRGVERMRRQFADAPHVNMTSVWTMAAALLVPPVVAAAVTVVLYLHLWWRSWRAVAGMQAFRVVFSACVVILSCTAVAALSAVLPGGGNPGFERPEGLFSIIVVVAVYWLVNSALVGVVIFLSRGERSLRRLAGAWSENSLEVATLCVGMLVAALVLWRPWLVVLVLPPLYVLHRSVLVRQLEYAATTDHKTGLLNASSWHSLAATEFERARRNGTEISVLMVDLDHFKHVNDELGHLVGDQVLRAVADLMRREVRRYDLCGRFGGEEFVVLLPETGVQAAAEVAERIRVAIREHRMDEAVVGERAARLRLTVSIGAAACPQAGDSVEDVLLAADNALFAAKSAGRDKVLSVGLP
ncbi:GGDEF domain-containing protein [Amycolatopsis magusensis]|uniref:Diguanylate cyclase (GGDEF)-like protein n=1 Tax=Amycolatopsis magusensis TaxID=882444 RepID=A0ABS4PZI0_9PSEU|nr:GGDEF domain-containing protein [Amycolatopsis magusensis]MBP2184833.1 diguanylate cyclase (GGDEF)-like protein [Amycolatopsis magusensis]